MSLFLCIAITKQTTVELRLLQVVINSSLRQPIKVPLKIFMLPYSIAMFQMVTTYRNWWLGPGIMDMFWNYQPFIVNLFDAVSDFNCIYSPCGSSEKNTTGN